MFIDTMASTAPDGQLLKRLELLTGQDGACCADDLCCAADALRDEDLTRALTRAKALADESRLLAARLIQRRGEMCNCEIQAALRLTHATVSHHMGTLVDAGIVESERRGKWVYYRIAPGASKLIP